MNKFLIILIGFGASILQASEEIPYLPHEYDAAKWPQATLTLSRAGTLKDLFDAGLRPYRHPGLENSLLQVKHLNLMLILGSGRQLPAFMVEWMSITVFTDGELSVIEASTPNLTLKQAREEMLKWLPFAENKRTQDELDKYLKAVEADYLYFDDPYRGMPHGCGIGWKEPGFLTKGGGPFCGLRFKKTVNPTHPLVLYIGLRWGANRVLKDRVAYRREPIPPPPGYEGVSMDAPRNFGPDSMVDILRAKGVNIGESPEAQRKWKQEWALEESRSSQTSKPQRTQIQNELTENPVSAPVAMLSHLKWWIVAILITGLGRMLWLALRRRS